MATEERALPLKQRRALGTAHLMNALCMTGMWFSYILTFFTKVIELPGPQAGLILFVVQFGGAIISPLVGVASDTCICAYGRRKIFRVVGMIDCLGCENAPVGYKVLYYSSIAVVVQVAYSGMQLAQLTLIPELATDKATRMQLNGIRYGQMFMCMYTCTWMPCYALINATRYTPPPPPYGQGSGIDIVSNYTAVCCQILPI